MNEKNIKRISITLILVLLVQIVIPIIGNIEITNVVNAEELVSGDYKYKILKNETIEISKYIGNDTEIIIPNTIDGKEITSIGYLAFENCKSLTSIKIPDSVIKINGFAFKNCEGLTNIEIPNKIELIDEYAFYYCSSLTNIDIPKSLLSIGKLAFLGCSNLISINVAEDNDYYTSVDGVLFDKEKEKIIIYSPKKENTEYVIPEGVVEIEEYAFCRV